MHVQHDIYFALMIWCPQTLTVQTYCPTPLPLFSCHAPQMHTIYIWKDKTAPPTPTPHPNAYIVDFLCKVAANLKKTTHTHTHTPKDRLCAPPYIKQSWSTLPQRLLSARWRFIPKPYFYALCAQLYVMRAGCCFCRRRRAKPCSVWENFCFFFVWALWKIKYIYINYIACAHLWGGNLFNECALICKKKQLSPLCSNHDMSDARYVRTRCSSRGSPARPAYIWCIIRRWSHELCVFIVLAINSRGRARGLWDLLYRFVTRDCCAAYSAYALVRANATTSMRDAIRWWWWCCMLFE